MPEILSFPTRTENTPSKVSSPMPLSVRHLAFQAGHTSILKGVTDSVEGTGGNGNTIGAGGTGGGGWLGIQPRSRGS